MNTPQQKITDMDLLMLYYGEHDVPALAATVADNPELSDRLEQLSQTLAGIEQAPLPEPTADYAQQVWQRLAPQLDGADSGPPPSPSRWQQLLLAPRFSLAGMTTLLAVAALAFMLGQNVSRQADPTLTLDSEALLLHELSLHLQQAELLLTEVANNGSATQTISANAQPLLRDNRLYRVAGGSKVSQPLSQLLLDMERLLLELSNARDSADLDPVRAYVDSNLLFRVRTLRHSLAEDNRI